MQPYVDFKKAHHLQRTAPTIETHTKDLKGHSIMVETYDYGHPMGWSKKGDDVRIRVFLDGELIVPVGTEGIIYERERPDWLPKGITIREWNNLWKGWPLS